jgi:hypothetical protein
VELLRLCARVDNPDPHPAVFAAGDQCLRINVLELRNRPPEKYFLVPVPNPNMIY